jgi:malonyl-CoA O-methyltransferase
VSRFVDMHDVGDMLVAAGFADPVMQMDMMTVTYDERRGHAARPQGDRCDERRAGAARER